jgi:hypothetical protein
MKRFVFFLVILLAIIIFLFYGLIKNKTSNIVNDYSQNQTDREDNDEESYVISESKKQNFKLVQKSKDVFTLKGQVSDGTHNQLLVRTTAKGENKVYTEETVDINDKPFTYDITMPAGQESAYVNIYYNEGEGLAVSENEINVVNDDGEWKISENKNTEHNSDILGQGDRDDFLYSDKELLELPQNLLTLSDVICKAHNNDYDKAYAIYEWLCEHIYLNKTEKIDDKSFDYIYNTRIADIDTYAQLYAAMLRIQNIPAAVVECENGYVFNEVFVNNKWINVQIDKDTFNKYVSHQYIYERNNVYTHFGVPIDIISANYIVKEHKK